MNKLLQVTIAYLFDKTGCKYNKMYPKNGQRLVDRFTEVYITFYTSTFFVFMLTFS